MPTNRVKLLHLFLNLQAQLAAELKTYREGVPHQGEKGAASEECWREMLRKHLPRRYGIQKAFVVDARDGCSDQIDIVIFDQQYAPFMFNRSGLFYVPAESVYAIMDVKQEVSKETIEETAEKAGSVRRLHRTNAVFNTASGPMRKNALFDIAAGIVALGSGWNPPLGTAFKNAIKATAKINDHRLNFGCAIEGGAFTVAYTPQAIPKIVTSDCDTALVTFLWQLVARLQTQGTAPAIEVPEYLNALKI